MECYHSGKWVLCSGWQPWGPDPYIWSVEKYITYTITDIGSKEYVEHVPSIPIELMVQM